MNIKPPPSPPSFSDFAGIEASAIDPAQKQDDLSEQIATLPEPDALKQIPLTEGNLSQLKKALEDYSVTAADAMHHPLASIVGTMDGCVSALSKAILNPIPFTSRRLPVLPLLSFKYLGLKKTLALYIAIGAAGGFYGRLKAASEIYQKTPEDNLTETITRLEKECSELKEQMLEARLKRLKALNNCRRLAPLKIFINDASVRNFFELTLNRCVELTMPTDIQFYEKVLQKQASDIQGLRVKFHRLDEKRTEGQDVQLKLLRTAIDLDAEEEAFVRVQGLLDSAKANPVVHDLAGHARQLDELEHSLSENSMLQETFEARKQYLEADSNFSKLQHDFIEKQLEFIKALVNKQRVFMARGEGMTTKKEDREASRAGVSASADSQSQTSGAAGSSPV
ncbi:hypothetical protein [Endozoicomonas sp. 8E]|uniref:hypothetical protein n=1 Tax=Endozoicomonas sp. 8E TaxID=3035692 RepID=UPI002938F032|nr:hypothetical protein [Endozoicomonas sp. 8E]WOG27849.1 hypothetical protein P6910_25425 [Endozoicomonas sp. 8E]